MGNLIEVGDRPIFSASRISKYLTCPRSYYFKYELGMSSDDVGWSALLGQAVHKVISDWHTMSRNVTLEDLLDWFEKDLRGRVAKESAKGNTVEKYEGEESIEAAKIWATELVGGYIADPRNDVELEINESKFMVEVQGTGKTKYLFTGFIDQLRILPDERRELTDLKTGKTKPNDFLLQLDMQVSIYMLACQKGVLVKWDPETRTEYQVPMNQKPAIASIAHMRDYEIRKKNEFAPKIKDPNKVKIPNPKGKGRDVIREIDNPKFAAGYKLGEQKGQVFYRTQRSEYDLRQAEIDIARICGSIRRRTFFRRPAAQGSCIGFCRFTKECVEERSEPI